MVSKLRKTLAHAVVPIAHVLAGATGGAAALHAVQPSEDVRITAVNVEMTSSAGNGITLFGENVADTIGFKEKIDVKLIDKKDYPKAIKDTIELFGTNSPTNGRSRAKHELSPSEKFEEKYHDDIQNALIRLGVKNVLVFSGGALAGSLLFQNGLWHYRRCKNHDQPKIPMAKRIGIPLTVAIIASSGTQIYNGHKVANDPYAIEKAERIISSPIEDYLVTSTSNMAVNLDTVTDQIRIDLARLTKIQDSLELGSQEVKAAGGDAHTLLIVADGHNLPTAPETIQSLLRASGAEYFIDLGDFVDVGIQPEIDALGGSTIGDTNFIGYDEISKCIKFSDKGLCTETGDIYKKYALLGNHDPHDLMDKLKNLGFYDLQQNKPAGLENTFALSDACAVDLGNIAGQEAQAQACTDDYKHSNKLAGTQALKALKNKQDTVPGFKLPEVGFFASDAAADAFVGNIPIVIYGGKHKFSAEKIDGTTLLGVASVGQGGARDADYAGAMLVTLKDDGIGNISLTRCLDIRWDVTKPGSGSIRPCFD